MRSLRPLAASCVVIAAALATELRAVLAGQGLDDVEVHYLPANLHNRPERIVPALRQLIDDAGDKRRRVRRLRRLRHGWSARCLPRRASGCRATPRRPLLRVLRRERTVRRPPRRRTGHVLPHRLPRQALRRVGLAGTRARSPPFAAADCTSATIAASSCCRRATTRPCSPPPRPRPTASGSSSGTSTPASNRSLRLLLSDSHARSSECPEIATRSS